MTLRNTLNRINGFLTPNKGVQRLSGALAVVVGVVMASPCLEVADDAVYRFKKHDRGSPVYFGGLRSSLGRDHTYTFIRRAASFVFVWLMLLFISMAAAWLLVRVIAWVVAGFRE